MNFDISGAKIFFRIPTGIPILGDFLISETLVVSWLVMIIITVFTIMYYIQVLFGMKVVKTNVKTGSYIGKIPGFAIFIGFVGAAVAGASMIFMAAETYIDYIGLIARGATAVWLLLISLWAIIYRATVKVK